MSRENRASDVPFSVVPHRSTAWIVFAVLVSAGTLRAQSDTQPPRLTGLTLDPGTVEVTNSSQIVTLQLHLQDDLSGVDSTSGNRVGVTLTSPSGNQVVSGLSQPQGGVILDGVFQVPVSIPRYAEPGSWRISSVRLRDNAGNSVSLDVAALVAAGLVNMVQVQDANPDTAPPVLQAVSLSPPGVDVSSAAQAITVDLVLTDDRSGVAPGLTSLDDFSMISPSGKQSRFLSVSQFQLLSGNSTSGTYRAIFIMPQYREPGVWKVNSVRLRDNVGSQRLYDATSLATFGVSIQLSVASNPSDSQPPQLTGLAISPSVINPASSGQNVQVEITATDDRSGVSFTPDTPFASQAFGGFFRSPSGAQTVSTDLSSGEFVSGIPTNGTWRFTAAFPKFSEEGTWKTTVYLKDTVRNLSTYSPSQLASQGISADLIVIRPTLAPDGTISDPVAGGSVSDGVFGDRAKVIVPPRVLSQPTAIAIDVLGSPLAVPLPTGFSGAETYFVNIEFFPQPTFPLADPGLTIVLPLRNFISPDTAIQLFRVDTATGSLVPAVNTSGNPVIGHVDSGGMTATFQGLSRLSTLVGLLPVTSTNAQVVVSVRRRINTRSHADIPVVIFSSPALDATQIDPSTLRFAGAAVDQDPHGHYRISKTDVNDDGLPDLIAHFRANELHLSAGDTQAVLDGRTFDNRVVHAVVSVQVHKGNKEDDEDNEDDHKNGKGHKDHKGHNDDEEHNDHKGH